MWWKKNKYKVILPVLIIAALAAAFYYGGNAPDARGWKAGNTPHTLASNAENGEFSGQAAESGTQTPEDTPAGAPDAPEPESSGQESGEERDEGDSEPPAEESPGEEQSEADAAESGDSKDGAEDAPASHGGTSGETEGEKDEYQTDPVPEGKPDPVEPQDAVIGTTACKCTVSIDCASILDNMELCDPEKIELVPEDGWILKPVEVTFYEGESVFNVIRRTCRQMGIHMEFQDVPIYNSAYVLGINNIYEFDVGQLSGWMYSVNGWFPNYGSSRYRIEDGDVINWRYSCDLGYDVGGGYAAGNISN